ncbi:hypothetical protein A5643_04445 [Mycobacterium sp. 1274756.6]|nr:hypothetical protein A5643_04445 [Mycobacterium sp. 1274756.6]
MSGPAPGWQRLSPRMLLVHPLHEVLRNLPLVFGAVVLGSTTGDPTWLVVALAITVGVGVARWATTSYRIDADEVQLRSGLLRRSAVAVPRTRIRSVATDARLLHRLLGLTVLRVSTAEAGASVFELDAVAAEEVPRLRTLLLAESEQPGAADADAPRPAGRVLARWQPSWLRYSPLSVSGLVGIGAVVGLAYQAGAEKLLADSRLGQAVADTAVEWGAPLTVTVIVAAVVVFAVLGAVGRSLLVYGNLVLTRRAGVLHLEHGLVRQRAATFDMRRLRGGTVREPLLVRALGGAQLDAVMTGVRGAGEASLLLPPCPASTAQRVLTRLIGDADAVRGPLRGHGPAAARRRVTRALAVPAVAGVVLLVVSTPAWAWVVWAVVTGGCVALALDRVRALGHRVDARWLVARSGSLERRRDCIATAGVLAWTVRQSWFQRRAGVATLVAATAAGVKAYQLIDVPAEWAWRIAATASPWVAGSVWADATEAAGAGADSAAAAAAAGQRGGAGGSGGAGMSGISGSPQPPLG